MNKKFYILTLTITSFIVIVIISFFVYLNKSGNQNKSEVITKEQSKIEKINVLPIEELVRKPKLEIPTEKGIINVKNVYQMQGEKLSNSGTAFEDNSYYYISYYPDDNSFNIVLNSPDVERARREAEERLLIDLGISKDEACQLNVVLGVPYNVNEKLSGRNFGLSFCPNGKPIK